MPNPGYAAFKAAAPYFDLVRAALGDLVDGEHFFDIVADDIDYEVLYDIAGWPRIIRGAPNCWPGSGAIATTSSFNPPTG
jgi:hypothetical protein